MRIFSLCELRNGYPLGVHANVTLVSENINEEGHQEELKFKPKDEQRTEQEANNSFASAADGRV